MKRSRINSLLGLSFAALALGAALDARAQSAVSATLSAEYFEVLSGTDAPDFGGSGTPNLTLGSRLGPNGLPVANATDPGVANIDPSTNEITWWSPSLNSAVVATGTGTIALPYAGNMYPPNSTGTNDASAFETAVFSGTFNLSTPSSVEFQLGSDDDSFIYVDGVLIGQNPGIHAVTNVDFTSGVLPSGTNTITVFYADREQVGAYLSLNLLTSGVVITPVPEPSTYVLMLAGIGFVGWGMRRRNRQLLQNACHAGI